jgi:hypothetical protein
VWVQSAAEVVVVGSDFKTVWRLRGGEGLEGARVWGVWFGVIGDGDGEGDGEGEGGDGDDGPPCPLLLMTVGGRIVVLASSSLGFCHELLQ